MTPPRPKYINTVQFCTAKTVVVLAIATRVQQCSVAEADLSPAMTASCRAKLRRAGRAPAPPHSDELRNRGGDCLVEIELVGMWSAARPHCSIWTRLQANADSGECCGFFSWKKLFFFFFFAGGRWLRRKKPFYVSLIWKNVTKDSLAIFANLAFVCFLVNIRLLLIATEPQVWFDRGCCSIRHTR